MAWAKNGTPDTLTSGADTITISDLSANKFNILLTHQLITSSGVGGELIFDNDTGSNYAQRRKLNGGSETTNTNHDHIGFVADNSAGDQFGVGYISNIDGEETLFIGFAMDQGGTGASNDPDRRELVAKDSGTTQFTRIDIQNINPGSGDFLTDSNLSVIGSD
jgi:hypothetical protein